MGLFPDNQGFFLFGEPMGDLTNNFSRGEFRCHCGCEFDEINLELVNQIQRFRDLLWIRVGFEVPITVTCGCRCEKHNARVGGAPHSYHMAGMAVDITFGSEITFWKISHIPLIGAQLAYQANKLGLLNIGGIGAYPKQNFIHLDIRSGNSGSGSGPVTWIKEKGVYRYSVNFEKEVKRGAIG